MSPQSKDKPVKNERPITGDGETQTTTDLPPVRDSKPSFGKTFVGYVTTANNVMVTIWSFVLAMFIGGLIIAIFDDTVRKSFTYFFARPGDAFAAVGNAFGNAYVGLFEGAILNVEALNEWIAGDGTFVQVLRPISETLTYSAPLICTGLAVGVAFKAGLFNIGAQGQAIMGAAGGLIVGFAIDAPMIIHLPLALIGGMLAGALYGAVPGVLKARTGAHEVITSIMLNYVAATALLWLISTEFVHHPTRNDPISKAAAESAQLPQLLTFGGSALRMNLGIIIAVLAAFVVWWLMSKSTLGFRMQSVGLNPDASRTAGMSVPGTYATSMSLAGAFAGLGGALLALGINPYALTPDVAEQIGFDGITVALLGRANPGGIVAAGLLFGAMRAGGKTMQDFMPLDMVTLLQALIVMFIAAPALVKTIVRLRTPKGGLSMMTAKGW
ncbi:ABC transporter permease [Stackebrandtia soli]|uniref:ABC transporter permease n=1 Tax=Stackebrandtia soli TaxID=1892856 RepID=UPI0039EA852C